MESLGEKFKTARNTRGSTIEQVARDTHIAKHFIAALEEEDFSLFHGDTYVLGFIRNYADYIGLEPVEMLNLYKNFKIQEQPPPIKELLYKKPSRTWLVVLIIVLLGCLGGGGFYLYREGLLFTPALNSHEAPPPPLPVVSPQQYDFSGEAPFERTFIAGDEVVLQRGGQRYTFSISSIESSVSLLTPLESMSLNEGEEAYARIPSGEGLIKIVCLGIDLTASPSRAVLNFAPYAEAAGVSGGEDGPAPADAAEAEPVSSSATGSTNTPSRVKPSRTLREAARPEPFMLEIEFRGYCLFRYRADNQNREERYFRSGETFRIDVRREIRLWYSNGASLRARVAGTEINLGKPGEVGAVMLHWTQEDGGARTYRLELAPMY